jgi:hypothetical protein
MEVQASVTSTDTSFINFAVDSGNAGVISWVTSDNSYAGTYTVYIIG